MVQDEILARLSSEQLRVYVVWTPILKQDDRYSATQAAALLTDERVVQFWDDDKSLGFAFGTTVTLPRGRELAWDVYFAFDRGAEWQEGTPRPTDWMHQLGTDDRLLDGDKLFGSVETMLQTAVP